MYLEYKKQNDFIGMDMARKFIQMGYTRARRYANHKGGRKYDKQTGEELPRTTIDEEKAESARIFKQKWDKIRKDSVYLNMKDGHREKFEQ